MKSDGNTIMLTLQKLSFILTPILLSASLLSGCQAAGHHVVAPVSSFANTVSQMSSKAASESTSKAVLSSGAESVSSDTDKVAYLTFDDGPTEMTPQIVAVLKQYQVKATFFVVYKNSQRLESYMKLASDEGNEIATHSYCHNYKQIYRSVNSFMEDYEKVNQWIESVTGKRTTQLRFPGGSSISKKYLSKPVLNGILSSLHDQGITHHDWNVSSGDASSKPQSKEKILENIKNEALNFDEPVILMHDVERNQGTLEALPEIIEWLRSQGYSFDTVSNIKHPAQHRRYSPPTETDSSQPSVSDNSSAPLPPTSSEVLSEVSSAESFPPLQSDSISSEAVEESSDFSSAGTSSGISNISETNQPLD